jgi:uncharacterized protein YbcV (DUF1398 family)
MPTLDQIQKIHDELGNSNTLASYLHALRSIGVLQYTSFISDGHSEYFCLNDEMVVSKAVHETFTVSDNVDNKQFLSVMSLTTEGKIGYIEMSKKLADSGIKGWVFDTKDLTISYIDKAGAIIYQELVGDASA